MTNLPPRKLLRYVLTISVCLTALLLSALPNNAQTGHRQKSLVTTPSTNVTKTFDPTQPKRNNPAAYRSHSSSIRHLVDFGSSNTTLSDRS